MISTKDFEQKQIIYVLLDEGECISFKNDNIIIKDKDDNTKLQTTCYRLFAVFVCGHFTLTSGIFERAKKFGFTLVLLSHSMKVNAIIPARTEGNVLLRRVQYNYEGFEIAAQITANKIHNSLAQLKKIRGKSEKAKEVIAKLKDNEKQVQESGLSLAQIMGFEGVSAKMYFEVLFSEYNWTARRPRVKHDAINCLMDIGYTMLFNVVNGIAELFGFDTYVGVLHREFYNRKSLVCDLVEPFRVIVDAAILKMLNLGQVHEKDFYINQKQYTLFGKNAVPYTQNILKAILEWKNEIFLYIQCYYRAFVRQKPISEYPVFDYETAEVLCGTKNDEKLEVNEDAFGEL